MSVYLSLMGGAGAQFFDNNGKPLAGGKVYSYEAGTTTPQVTYTDVSGNTAHPNPIILDSAGRVPNSGEIWLTGASYKFVLHTANDLLIETYDNVSGANDFSSIYANFANTLDVAEGDALVGFRQSNSSGVLANAVGRTVHDKLQEIVSVKDFGAVGDGVADDYQAIQDAIDYFANTAVAGNGGGTVYVPAGRYRITQGLLIGYGVTILGDGAGGYPYIPETAKASVILADFGNNINQWAIDSATYKTSNGNRIAYNEYVNGNIDGEYNSLHGVEIRGISLIQAGDQTQVPWGGIRLIGCPNMTMDLITVYGFGVAVQLNTCFGSSVTRINTQSNYYGLMCYNANNNIYVQGQFDKIIEPLNLPIPTANIPSWMPDATYLTTGFYMDGSHYDSSKGVTIAADVFVGSNSTTLDVITQYWQDCAFLYNTYANTFLSLYAEGNQCENVLSSAQSSWTVVNMQNFASTSAYVIDAGLQTIGQINVGGNNISTNFFNHLWNSFSPSDPSYVLVQNSANTVNSFGVPDHPRLRRLVGQERGTVTMTVGSATGTISSVTDKEAYYVKEGNQVTVYFTFKIANNGTGAGYITVEGMPYPCSSTIGASGTAYSSSKGLCNVRVTPTFSTFIVEKYDATYPAVTGDVIYGSFTYYTASTV